MEKYDYFESMRKDIREYLKETDERDFDTLYDSMFIDDSITGNASGSYTFSTYEAEENICHNLDLLKEACDEFCCSIPDGAEACDVTIRCYLLGQVLGKVLEELEEEEIKTNEK